MIKKMDIRLDGIGPFSSYDSSLLQLSREMDDVYGMLCKDSNWKVSLEQFCHIQLLIFNGYYVFKPLRMLNINMKSFYNEVARVFPDIMIERVNIGSAPENDSISVVMPSDQGDSLIFQALSAMLLRLTHGSLYDGVFRLDYGINTFYNRIKEMRDVVRVYHLDLTESLKQIPISIILDSVSSLVGEGTGVSKLIKSFLDIEIIDDSGNSKNKIAKEGVPPAGEITRVLFNIVLNSIFDRNLEKRYPGVAFARFRGDVLIFETRYVQYSNLNEKAIRDLLKELNLQGYMCSFEPGGIWMFSKKIAVLSTAGQVFLYDPFANFPRS